MKRRDIERVTFRAGMSRKEIGWRMVLVGLLTNRRKLEQMQAQVKHMTASLAVKAEQIKKVRAEKALKDTLVKLGLLK